MAYRPTLQGSGRPKPFQRKRIELSTEIQDVKKSWQDVEPDMIEEGDIIPGFGLVVKIKKRNYDPVQYKITFKNGDDAHFNMGGIYRVFTRVRG